MALLARLRGATYASTQPLRLAPSVAKCVRVYDGDTVWLAFEHAGDLVRCSARLIGVDTPEVRTRDAVEKRAGIGARDELRALILDKLVHVQTASTSDKYGRLLVTLWAEHETPSVDASINTRITRRWGVEYHGGRKLDTDWSTVPRENTSLDIAPAASAPASGAALHDSPLDA